MPRCSPHSSRIRAFAPLRLRVSPALPVLPVSRSRPTVALATVQSHTRADRVGSPVPVLDFSVRLTTFALTNT